MYADVFRRCLGKGLSGLVGRLKRTMRNPQTDGLRGEEGFSMCHEKSWRAKGGVDGLDLGRQEVFLSDHRYEYLWL